MQNVRLIDKFRNIGARSYKISCLKAFPWKLSVKIYKKSKFLILKCEIYEPVRNVQIIFQNLKIGARSYKISCLKAFPWKGSSKYYKKSEFLFLKWQIYHQKRFDFCNENKKEFSVRLWRIYLPIFEVLNFKHTVIDF